MFKKSSLAIAAVLLASSASSFAAAAPTATANMNVSATLTPLCSVSAANVSVSYTSLQASDATGTGQLTVKCTAGHGYSVAINAASSTIMGLTYSVGIVDGSGAAASSGVGTGANDLTKFVKATIAGGQGGTITGGNYSESIQHTVTVTY